MFTLNNLFQVFGGGTKPLLDANVQKIVDAGFTEEQAENTLKYTKNNVDRALRILQKRDNSENRNKEKQQKEQEPSKRKGRNKESNDEDGIPVKPSGKVSLFDFLEDKLPNVPDKDKSNRQNNTYTEERIDKGYNSRDKSSAKSNPRGHGSRYDGPNRQRSENRGHYSNENAQTSHRDERKYQTQNEKPPRFQKKLDEKNKQQQQYSNNVNMNMSYNNSYHNPLQQQPQYEERNLRNDRNINDNKMQQHNYNRNPNNMDNLVEAANNLNLMCKQTRPEEVHQGRSYHQQDQSYPPKQAYVQNQNIQDVPPFRRANEMHKYQEQYQRRQQQPNGYIEQQQAQMYTNLNYMSGSQAGYGGRQYGYGARPQDYNAIRGGGPFLPGSLLGFQNAAVNEQARAMLGVAEINWKIGDRCLALYWEDNNVSFKF